MDITLYWFVLKRLFYAEQNEYRKHTLDKYFTACVADAAYRGLLSATQALSTTSGKVTTDVILLKHKNGSTTLPTSVKASVGKSHDRCEINETQEWISHCNGSFSSTWRTKL